MKYSHTLPIERSHLIVDGARVPEREKKVRIDEPKGSENSSLYNMGNCSRIMAGELGFPLIEYAKNDSKGGGEKVRSSSP